MELVLEQSAKETYEAELKKRGRSTEPAKPTANQMTEQPVAVTPTGDGGAGANTNINLLSVSNVGLDLTQPIQIHSSSYHDPNLVSKHWIMIRIAE